MIGTEKIWRWTYLGIAVLMFAGMVLYSGFQEFWYDEVYQVGLVGSGKSISDVFRDYTQLKDYTPPLYALISYVWIRIVPFSFRYFILISELMTAVGVWICALVGEAAGEKKMGLLTGLFAAVSSTLVLAAGYEFRSYALYFMASAIVLYRLVKRLGGGGGSEWKCRVYDTLALVLLLYSHYYGSILLGVLFGLELFFVLSHRQKAKVLVPYIVSFFCFLPWLALVFLNRTRSITEFWIQPPDLQSVFKLFRYLCSDNELLLAFLCMGLAGCLVSVVGQTVKRQFCFQTDAWKVYVVGVLLGTIGVMFLYGAVINPSGGIFYNRYFTGVLPCCFLLMAQGVILIWDRLAVDPGERGRVFAGLCLAVFLFVSVQNGNDFLKDIKRKPSLSYTASVRALSRKEDIESPDTLVVTSDNPYVRAGVEMYFEKFFHTKPNVISQHDTEFSEEYVKYGKIYLFNGKQPLTDETKEIFSRLEMISEDQENRICEYAK